MVPCRAVNRRTFRSADGAVKVCVFRYQHPRSRKIADALADGARRLGWGVVDTEEEHFQPKADMLLAYGWRNQAMFEAYRRAGLHFIYVDLGYWQRKRARSDYGGNHKVVLDGRHATGYFRRGRPMDRLEGSPPIGLWQQNGRHIVLAGLSAKGAVASGMRPLAWEHVTIAGLRKLTDRPIVYRPKPSWRDARPIDKTIFSPGEQPIEEVLQGAHMLVTLHSNAALDALAAGVPIYAAEGLASVMSTSLENIETPHRPADRRQFFADVSYAHFTRHEIASGMVFEQFMADGLLAA